MEWLLESGSFVCERTEFHGKQFPCPICEAMPKPDRWVLWTLKLYQRCQERKALPCSGGVLDQPDELMEAFDVIDNVVARHKKAAADRQQRDIELRCASEGTR